MELYPTSIEMAHAEPASLSSQAESSSGEPKASARKASQSASSRFVLSYQSRTRISKSPNFLATLLLFFKWLANFLALITTLTVIRSISRLFFLFVQNVLTYLRCKESRLEVGSAWRSSRLSWTSCHQLYSSRPHILPIHSWIDRVCRTNGKLWVCDADPQTGYTRWPESHHLRLLDYSSKRD